MGKPVVEHFDTTVFLNSPIFARDLVNVFHTDGEPIDFIQFEDYQSAETTGFFRLNGVAIQNGSQFRVTPQELFDGLLEYIGGSQIEWEGYRAIAYANGVSSGEQFSGRIYTVRENVNRPTVSDIPIAALADELTPLAPFLQARDSDGFPILAWQIRDQPGNPGELVIDGEVAEPGVFHFIRTENLDNVYYRTDGPAFTESLDKLAYDGELWSVVSSSTITSIPNVNRPVAQFTRGTADSNEVIPMAPLANITDDDGNTIKSYSFWNTSPHAIHGDLIFNGVVQPRKTWIDVPADQLDQLFYQAPNQDFVQQIRYRGTDGRFQSGNSTISITTNFVIPPTQPMLSSDDFFYDEQLEVYTIDQLFARTDSGNVTTRYQVFDSNAFDQRSARFEFNNNNLEAGVIHDFTAAEAQRSLRFRTGDFNNRHRDDLLVRVQNSDGLWSQWEKLITRTEPEHFGAHDSGSTWNNFDVPRDSLGRMEFSYSFMQAFPDYNTGAATDDDPPNNFGQFSQAARTSVRRVFDDFEAITNVKFVEVSDTSTNAFGGQGGIYRFGNYGNDFGDEAAFAFFPSLAPEGGDSWYDRFDLGTVFFDSDGDGIADNISGDGTYVSHIEPDLAPYTFGYFALIHELMHNFGFNHVFDDSGGSAVLPESTRDANFSTLVNGDAVRFDVVTTTPQLYDVESLHIEYGVNTNFNPGDDLYSLDTFWNERPLFSETLWDGGGNDTLSLEGSNPARGFGFPNRLDLTPGGFSSFNGLQDNVALALRIEIENAIGSALDDEIIGNHLDNVITAGDGDDQIEGSSGNDTLTGGRGDDLFIFSVGDGDDVIDEQRLAGRDRIQLTTFPTLDSLEEDFVFRKEGRDLIITLQLDNADISEGSIRITNQVWGSYQIETLELNGTPIDLRNLGQQATVVDQKFTITDDTSIFGNLVAPV